MWLAGGRRTKRKKRIPANVEVGAGTIVGSDVRFLTWLPTERIVIGRYCSIGPHGVIFAGGNHRTDIASTFAFDHFLLGQPFPSRTYQTTPPTVIGNDVWLGRAATVLGGVRIGDGAVVAAGAVVFSEVPPYAVVAGNPARVMRYRFSQRTVARLLKIGWWNWSEAEIRENMEWLYKPINEFVAHFDRDGE